MHSYVYIYICTYTCVLCRLYKNIIYAHASIKTNPGNLMALDLITMALHLDAPNPLKQNPKSTSMAWDLGLTKIETAKVNKQSEIILLLENGILRLKNQKCNNWCHSFHWSNWNMPGISMFDTFESHPPPSHICRTWSTVKLFEGQSHIDTLLSHEIACLNKVLLIGDGCGKWIGSICLILSLHLFCDWTSDSNSQMFRC